LERNTKFETLGIDSLEVMEIVVAMEESFGLELSDE
jgi:acyl carrier protein